MVLYERSRLVLSETNLIFNIDSNAGERGAVKMVMYFMDLFSKTTQQNKIEEMITGYYSQSIHTDWRKQGQL